MGCRFEQTPQGLAYREEGGLRGLRIVAAVFGLLFLAASPLFIVMLVRSFDAGAAHGAAQWAGRAASVLGFLAFAGFGAACMWIALWLPLQDVLIDVAAQAIRHTTRAPAVPQRTRMIPIAAVRAVSIETSTSSDGEVSHGLRIDVGDAPALRLGLSEQRADVEHWRGRVIAAIAAAGGRVD